MAEKICDFRCWMAKGSTCRCHCVGANHGCGRIHDDPVFMALIADPEINKYGFTEAAYERKRQQMIESGQIS